MQKECNKESMKTRRLFTRVQEVARIAVEIERHMSRKGASITSLAEIQVDDFNRERIYRVARWLGYNVVKKKNGTWIEYVNFR